MLTMIKNLDFNKEILQKCPICGVDQPIILKGLIKDIQNLNNTILAHDKGYSFCNCHNIYYTKWKNIEQEIYDNDYVEKYEGTDHFMKKYWDEYGELINKLTNNGSLLEIGSINDGLLNEAKKSGFITYGLDIPKRASKHTMFFGNFENIKFQKKYDVVFASHVFEHFKDPIAAVKKCNKIINKNGVLFIAMPDPYFIDYSYVYNWGHWHVKEHHIMWDMESFIDVVESNGFKCKLKFRNTGSTGFICWGDYHLIFQKEN